MLDQVSRGAFNGAIRGAIIGAVVGLVAYIAFVTARFLPVFPDKKCPECSADLPKHRKPANFGQVLSGKWSCPKCGCQLAVLETKAKK